MSAFMALEGVDGAGKSTQVKLLARKLEGEGRTVLTVREPGGTELGERVREILLGLETPLEVESELLLFLASRVQLYEGRIRPALAEGAVVISDRFHLSSLLYQGIARGLGEERTRGLLESVLGDRRPALNVVLTLPFETCLTRLGGEADRYESAPEVLRRVWEGYESTTGLEGDRIVRVDAEGEVDEVARRVYEAVSHAL